MVNKSSLSLVGAALLALYSQSSSASVLIDTMQSWVGGQFISSFGVVNTATYGQVVTVPAGETTLTSFTMKIFQSTGAASPFRGEVYAWNGTQATGPALYESAPINSSGSAGAVYQDYTFITNIPVTAGQQYVLFVTTSRDQAVPDWNSRFASVPDATYPGGNFVFINNSSNVNAWTTQSWSMIAEDLAFQANFGNAQAASTAVPTLHPAVLAILAGGLGFAGLSVLRRGKNPG
jgi:hypothetical protein